VLGGVGVGLIGAQLRLARRTIGTPFGADRPDADGLYGAGVGDPIELAVLGDSSAAGLGAEDPAHTPGAVLARGLSAVSGRAVRLTTVAVVGATSADLIPQVDTLLAGRRPSVTVVMVGANDVTHRVRPAVAVRHLAAAVERLVHEGSEVVVGTCPDLGTIEPVPQPLRAIARRLSRDLAAAQTVAAVEAGARTVCLGDLLDEHFRRTPGEMFSADRFHPSSAGYAAVAAALLPSTCAAMELWPDGGQERAPDASRGERVDPIAVAASAAAASPGAEVHAAEVAGQLRGPRGRWAAVLLRRRIEPAPGPGISRHPDPTGADPTGADPTEPARTAAAESPTSAEPPTSAESQEP
jgi:lysophospholipase L1-like esterase